MIHRWKRIKRRVLFEHPRLTLLEDTVTLPDGKQIPYFLAAPPNHDSVSVITVNDKDEILAQQQYNYPLDKVLWELPGGNMERGESPEQAALRELAEETGYTADTVTTIGSFYTQNRFKNAKQFVVLCKDVRPFDLPSDDSEFIETAWISQKKLVNMIKKGQIQNINMLASLMLYYPGLIALPPDRKAAS